MSYSNVQDNARLFSTMVVAICILTSRYKKSLLSTFSLMLSVLSPVHFCQSSRHKLIPHHDLGLVFLTTIRSIWASFYVYSLFVYYFLKKIPVNIFCQFLPCYFSSYSFTGILYTSQILCKIYLYHTYFVRYLSYVYDKDIKEISLSRV